jgi:phosphoenolpyruvate---glycerone phosphotransferase subunit DhaK
VKKLINAPSDVVREMMEGLVSAYGGSVHILDGVNAIVRSHIEEAKVALLVGGGSGHEPVYHGLVGPGLADGAAIGNVFAAPSPEIVLEATKAVNRGKGVLYVYGNYSGDNMNFDIGAELAAESGIVTRTVRIADDVAIDKRADRRGIAGLLFVVKIAGAACAEAATLEEAERVARKAVENVRTMGIALSAGTNPESGEPTFLLGDDDIEIGMGLHGEPGVSRGPMKSADELVDLMMDRILPDLPYQSGDEVAVLINDLGATTTTELLIVNRHVREILSERGIRTYDTVIGSFCTSQEMAGASITLLRLDDELKHYYDMSADSFAYRK